MGGISQKEIMIDRLMEAGWSEVEAREEVELMLQEAGIEGGMGSDKRGGWIQKLRFIRC